MQVSVGSRVRVPLVETGKFCRRGIIATVQEADGSACVLLEENVTPVTNSYHHCRLGPTIRRQGEDEMDMEVTCAVRRLQPLLEFELASIQNDTSPRTCKAHGDELLQRGDALAAMEYYQRGIAAYSQQLSVGTTIVIKQGGFTKLAEVDCLEADGSVMDVSLITDGTEVTIGQQEVVTAIPSQDHDRLQERILLNLSRCCLQAIDYVPVQRKPLYVRGAVLACTVAMDIAQYYESSHDSEPSTSPLTPWSTHKTALILRSKAQTQASKLDHAKADLKRLLSIDPDHPEGNRLLRQLEQTIKRKQSSDKKLVKEMCKWVNAATESSVSGAEQPDADSAATADCRTDTSSIPVPWVTVLIAILIAYYFQTKL